MKYETIAKKIGQLVDKKNEQYGDAFLKVGEFLKILYPNGVQPHQYQDMLVMARIFDKQMRVANGNQGDENAFTDIAGYGILMSGRKGVDNTKELMEKAIKAYREKSEIATMNYE
ncbi:hypothetical protein [Alkalihalobacillus trypoxylicola]|uniref:Uncharacterized protein n=1 Tax=Alkalihalobacillus trypoxylicola TaxID=519424 RepID=A0A162D5B2_9BACI|nr:hypothetical protein [Alkalihalobacillus trypoxylicola]KYG28159.1 hypothetical protein AZF04_09655 [Alkalihalobacillus trypoxylicola]